MKMIIWTSAPAQSCKSSILYVLDRARQPYTVSSNTNVFPDALPGDVVLACGSKALAVLMNLRVVPKNRTIASLREKSFKTI